ncbi:MAG: hydrogenase nickel incorporation protein HypA/HybF [Psychromonas sp.]|jgi:hydrogenase nickel incorporation protein HypA/HybF|uniref:hydrogenase maturation nickel metallochaperone HypA n=1 Tax=Psychromonas sp. TaxID=1884585 RepID=UPI0039E4F657
MHELSIAESIIDLLEEHAITHKFKKVTKITLEIGVLAGIEKSALFFCFDAAAQNSIAQGAQLLIEEKLAKGFCKHCQCQVTATDWYQPCPYCGQLLINITEGEQMNIKSLEVEN